MDDQIQVVEVPGYGEVEFPASMSDADILAAVRRLAPSPQKSAAEQAEGQRWPGQAKLTQADRERVFGIDKGVGDALAVSAGLAGGVGLAPTAGRLLTAAAPLAKAAGAGAVPGAVIGGAEGLFNNRGVIRGAMHGAAQGAMYGAGLRGGAGMLRTVLGRGAVRGGATAGAAKDALSKLNPNMIKSPADWAARDQLLTNAGREASEAGTINAGRQIRGFGPIDDLFELFLGPR